MRNATFGEGRMNFSCTVNERLDRSGILLSSRNRDLDQLPVFGKGLGSQLSEQSPCDFLSGEKVDQLRIIDHIRIDKFMLKDGFAKHFGQCKSLDINDDVEILMVMRDPE